jgi:sugar O-acyltransferase (sialic acid O-acetyltransferase NeuD family)
MIIVGAGGFATEVLSCVSANQLKSICFFDDVNPELNLLFGQFKVLKYEKEVSAYFTDYDRAFTIGIGNPKLRQILYEKFIKLGGKFTSVISDKAFIGSYNVELGEGVNILPGVNISNNVHIGKGTMVYYNTNITHDCQIGDFVEIAPGVQILGRVTVGNNTIIGSGAIILPDVTIGKKAVIGAGAVVTKDVQDGQTVMGIPAKQFLK